MGIIRDSSCLLLTHARIKNHHELLLERLRQHRLLVIVLITAITPTFYLLFETLTFIGGYLLHTQDLYRSVIGMYIAQALCCLVCLLQLDIIDLDPLKHYKQTLFIPDFVLFTENLLLLSYINAPILLLMASGFLKTGLN